MTQALKTTALILALTAGAFASTGEARDHGRERPTFEQLDSNGDGQITQDELQARGAARFAEADSNGDGALSRAELEAQASERMASRIDRMMERLDSNGDGQLSQDEMQSRRDPSRMFARLDTDESGGISQEEFEAMKTRGGKRSKPRASE